MSQWKEIKLRDVCSDISYGYTASATDKNTGYKFLRITDIVNSPFSWESVPYCEINSKDAIKYRLTPGDIVIARTGATTGTTYTIKDDTIAVYASYLIRYQIDKSKADPFFIGYCLRSENWKGYVENIIGGSAQPGANAQQFADYEILLPSHKEQQSIAEVLSSLDDKIDLLHRQNKTLEQMAETLFRQWFVEEGKEDWIEKSIEDVADINPATISKKFEFSRIEYLDTGSITKGAIESFLEVDLSEAPSRAQRCVRDNDIVFSLVRPNQCHYGILNGTKPNTIVSTGFCVIRANKISPFFLYLLLTNQTNVEYFHSIAEGSTSTYPSLRPEDIAKFTFNFPPEKLCNNFHQQASSFWDKIYVNQRQIKKLISLRDMLLPKLMNGTTRVTNN